MKCLLIVLASFFLVSCKEKTLSMKGYFPYTNETGNSEYISRVHAEYYCLFLSKMGEERIYSKRYSNKEKIYRLTILRESGQSSSVTAFKKNNYFFVRFIDLGKGENISPGEIVFSDERKLEKNELNALFEKSSFLDESRMKTVEDGIHLGGGCWIFESLARGEYKLIVRHNLSQNFEDSEESKLLNLCNFLLELKKRT